VVDISSTFVENMKTWCQIPSRYSFRPRPGAGGGRQAAGRRHAAPAANPYPNPNPDPYPSAQEVDAKLQDAGVQRQLAHLEEAMRVQGAKEEQEEQLRAVRQQRAAQFVAVG